MANDSHVRLVLAGPKIVSLWRQTNPDTTLDLSGADLRRVDFVHANLNGAILRDSNLEWADFRWADLIGADLSGARLPRADFHKADLTAAVLKRAELIDTNFEDANLRGADLAEAIFGDTRFINTDLATANGLAVAVHRGPSNIDVETLAKSGYLPSEFLRGCGVSDAAIEAAHSYDENLLSDSLERGGDYYSSFISHSSRDTAFVRRLYADLQANDVRCWYAPHDMRIGDRILDALYSAIRKQEKLLLVLSKESVASEWVRDEVEKAFAEERDRGTAVVFPIRIDDSVMTSRMAWAEKIRAGRHMGDFRQWQNQAAYGKAFKRLLRDLRREPR